MTKNSNKIKLFQNFGAFPDSKVQYEHVAKRQAVAAASYVLYDNYKTTGYIAYAADSDLVLVNIETGEEKTLVGVFDSSMVLGIKLVERNKKLYVLAVNRNGRFNTIATKIEVNQ